MRRTLFLLAVLAPVVGLLAIVWDWRGSAPEVLRRPPGAGAAAGASARQTVVSLADGSGRDLFLKLDEESVIAGVAHNYARAYAAATSWEAAGGGLVLVQDPILLLNAQPRNEHERARLLVIDTSGAQPASEALRDAFGRHTGIRSRSARIHGSADLKRVSRIEFHGDVEAVFVDPETPGDRLELRTESLAIDLDGNAVVAIRTEDAFTVTRARAEEFKLEARGLDLRPREGTGTLAHDVRVTAMLPGWVGGDDAPLAFAAPGPVTIAAPRSDAASNVFTMAGGRVTAAGGVTFSHGAVSGSGREAILECDDAGKIAKVDVVQDVRIEAPDGVAEGSRLTVTPRDATTHVRLAGEPVRVRFGSGAPFVASGFGDDAALETSGTITVSAPAADGTRRIEAGPDVTIAGKSGRAVMASVAIRFAPRDARGERTIAVLCERLDAKLSDIDVVAERFEFARVPAADAVDDIITLPGAYDIRYRPAGSAPLHLAGPGGLRVVRPAFDARPLVATATDRFRLAVASADPAVEDPRLVVEARTGMLVAEVASAARAPGLLPGREVTSFDAEGRVRVEAPGSALARGETLGYDGRLRTITLAGTDRDDGAVVERIGGETPDRLTARTLTFHLDILRLIATQRVRAEIALERLPWIGDPPAQGLVRTNMAARRLVVDLDAERFAAGEYKAQEILAELAVRIEQADRRIWADQARLDFLRRFGSLTGSPVRYEVTRALGDKQVAEGLLCPRIVFDDDRVLVDGPAEATLHARPILPGTPLRAAREGEPEVSVEAPPPTPLNLRCGRRAVLTKEAFRAEGRAGAEQDQGPGGLLSTWGDVVTMFLQQDPARPDERPGVVLAVIEGSATIKSGEIDAACDVIKINRVMHHASFLNQRSEKVVVIVRREVFGGEIRNDASRIDIDFSDPARPRVIAFGHDVEAEVPESRSTTR